VKHEITTMPKEIDKLKADVAKATDPAQKATLQENLRQAEEYFDELKTMQVTLPTLTFDRSLILHDKARTVEILWLGKAHTDGDVFVYLPKEKFIATGDALHGWTPFLNDGYPYDWVRTLDAAEKLDFDYVLGGHGDVMRGKDKFELWKQYFTDLMAETAEVFAQGATLDEARKQVLPKLELKYAAKFPPTFSKDAIANIEKAYRVVSGATE
jgi:glyoxylase-like metal-dependent hydrolase (beta-lactamase superfamily II)